MSENNGADRGPVTSNSIHTAGVRDPVDAVTSPKTKTKKGQGHAHKGYEIRYRNFARWYVLNGNGTVSALKAGYTKRSAFSTGSNLLRNPKVQQLITEERERLKETAQVEDEVLLTRLRHEMVHGDTSASRIKATEILAKIKGLIKDRHILVVEPPAYSAAELRAGFNSNGVGGDDGGRYT